MDNLKFQEIMKRLNTACDKILKITNKINKKESEKRMENTDIKVVRSSADAKFLLKRNFHISSIKADKDNPDKTVFIFDDRASVIAALNELHGY